MRSLIVALLISSCLLLGCSEDCSKPDWIGTFIKDNEICGNSTPIFSNSITITDGGCFNCIEFNSFEILKFDGNCTVISEGDLFGDVIRTLEGNTLNVSMPFLDCSANYVKQ